MSVVRGFVPSSEPLTTAEEARFRALAEREPNFGPAAMSWIPGLLATLDALRGAGTLDEAWAAAEAALPKRHSLHLDTNGRGTYVARSLPPFMPYEEWFEARREEFGDSPAEALTALATALRGVPA